MRIEIATGLALALVAGCAEGYEPTTTTRRSHVEPRGARDAGEAPRGAPATGDAGVGPGDSGPPGSDAGVLPEALPLPCGRTYDQDTAYFDVQGDVSVVTLEHRDGTSLPAGEGGASCGGGCSEQVTRLGDGASISGVISAVDTFSVQVAVSGAPGVGALVVTACGVTIVDQSMAAGSATSTAGFVNLPVAGAWPVPAGATCAFTISARGGYVDLRAVTTACAGGPTPPLM